MVEWERSASQTTMSRFSRPNSTRVRPKASRVAAPSFTSNLVLAGMVIEAPVGPVRLRPAWGHAVKLGIVLHEGDALALDGVGHDAGGPELGGLGFPKRFLDGGEIVAVDLQ